MRSLSEAVWRAGVVRAGKLGYESALRLAHRALGLQEARVTIEGTAVPFLVGGWGPALVLVHGFGADREGFLPLVKSLSGLRRTVIVPDLPGFGDAGPIPPSHATARHFAHTVSRLVEACGFARADLLGSSMGGAVALRLAADEPPKVRSLVLVGSVGPHVDRGELAQELRQGRNPLLAQSAEEFRALLDFVFAKPVKLPPVVGHYVLRKRIARYPVERELFDGWVTSMEGEGGLPRQWDKIVAPALVVHGDRDRVIPLDTAQALAEQLPHARLALLGDVGHLPHVEVPRRVAELVREFYERAG